MTRAGRRLGNQPGSGIPRKVVSCVCAAALTLSLGVMVPLEQVLPDQFDGGAAYAASGKLKSGKISTTSKKTTTAAKKTTAQAALLTEGTYRLTSMASTSLSMDVPSGTWSQNAQLQLWSTNNLTPQAFVFKKAATNVFTIQAACSGKYLADSNGKVVQQSKVSTSLYQRWQVVKEGNSLALKNVKTGRMLATSGTARNAKLITRTQRNNNYERWRFSTTNILVNGTYLFSTALGNNKVLDVSAASTSNCANVQLWSDNGTNAQKWQVTHVGSGYYKIINAASGKALDINRNTNNAQQYTYTNNCAAELWKAEVSDKGGFLFVNKLNGKALDVANSRAVDGSNVNVYTKGSYNSERWYLYATTKINPGTRTVNAGISVKEVTNYNGEKTVTIPNGMYTVRNAMGRMLDVSAASTAAGANVQIWSNNGSNAQKWNIASVGNGYYTFKSVCSGYSLDVVNGLNANGTNVRQWFANTSGAQRWKAELNGNALVFRNQATGKVLDVSGCWNADGTNVQIWDYNGSNAQRWTLSKTTASPVADNYTATVERDIFNAYNNYRASKGLPRVAWDENKANIARSCSRNCGNLGYLQHGTAIPNYGTSSQNMSDILQYATWKMTGQEAVNKWIGSTGHRRMMQCDSATSAGVGVCYANGRYYYTIVYDFNIYRGNQSGS